ncbi:MAG: hypothetical protein ACOYWZ_01630 [Bacillota bacterium]
MLIVGIDGGNNTVITALKGREPLIIPTILAPYRDYDQGLEMPEYHRKPLKDCLDAEVVLNYQNEGQRKELGRFYVGKLAKELEGINIRERNIGKTKKGDQSLLVCMLVSLAASLVETRKVEKGKVSEQIKMVTGLPCLQYKGDRLDYSKQFLGCHKIIFRGSYNIEVEIDISDVEVEMEGAGALRRLIFNDSGEYLYKEEELIDRTILGIEVGEFTSEIIALTFKETEEGKILPEYRQKLCMGIDMGIANAKQPVIDYLRDKFNTVIDRYGIDVALRRKQRRGEIDLESGDTLNIVELFQEHLLQLAQLLSNLINNKVKSAGEKGKIKHTLLFGGGVCVLDYRMGNFLKESTQELIGGISSIVENPHTANALSYLEKALSIYVEPGEAEVPQTKVNFSEQNRLLYDPGDGELKKDPQMPLQAIIICSGTVWEAKTIRGAAAVIIGNEYLYEKDSTREWSMRVEAAKKEAFKAAKAGINAVVFDSRKGIISGGKDSKNKRNDDTERIKIHVENDRLFLLSLVRIGALRILEREDTYFLRPHQKWNLLMQSKGALQCCSNCLHRIYDKRIICPVYNEEKEQTDGTDCGSYTIYPGSFTYEYPGGKYIDISEESSIEELLLKVGQLWMVEGSC